MKETFGASALAPEAANGESIRHGNWNPVNNKAIDSGHSRVGAAGTNMSSGWRRTAL